jgi:hypothetical protein
MVEALAGYRQQLGKYLLKCDLAQRRNWSIHIPKSRIQQKKLITCDEI